MELTARHLWRTSLAAAAPAHPGASWAAIGVIVFLVAAGGLLADVVRRRRK